MPPHNVSLSSSFILLSNVFLGFWRCILPSSMCVCVCVCVCVCMYVRTYITSRARAACTAHLTVLALVASHYGEELAQLCATIGPHSISIKLAEKSLSLYNRAIKCVSSKVLNQPFRWYRPNLHCTTHTRTNTYANKHKAHCSWENGKNLFNIIYPFLYYSSVHSMYFKWFLSLTFSD
jgi:hypothetical protein